MIDVARLDKLESYVETLVVGTAEFSQSEKYAILDAISTGNSRSLSDRCKGVLDEFRKQLSRPSGE